MMKSNTIKSFAIVFAIAVVLVLGLLCSCNTISSFGKIKVKDLCGRTVTFDKPVEKIVALSASDCEILDDIEASDKIIARGTYCDYPEKIKAIKDVGSGELTNIEEIVAMQPDVVLMSKTGFTLDQVNAIEKAGIKTLVNEVNTFEDVYSYITQLGKVTGKNNEAEGVVLGMRSSVLTIEGYASDCESKSIYFQLSDPAYGYWTAGRNTYLDEIATMLNCTNIFSDMEGWVQVSKEQLEARHPDVIIKTDDIPSSMRPGPRLIDAIDRIYAVIYE